MKLPRYKIILGIFDYLIINLAFAVALRLRFMPKIDIINLESFKVIDSVLIFALISISGILAMDKYDLYKYQIFMHPQEEIIGIFKSLFLYFIPILIFLTYAFKLTGGFDSRLFIIYFIIIDFVLLLFWRLGIFYPAFNYFQKRGVYRRNLAIYGTGKESSNLLESVKSGNRWNFIGYIDERPKDNPVALNNLEELDVFIKQNEVEDIIIAVDNITHERLLYLVEVLQLSDVRIYFTSNLYSILTDFRMIEEVEGVQLIALNYNSRLLYLNVIKRLMDMALTSVGIVLLIPVFLIVGLSIKLTSRGPIIFCQERIGKNGKKFKFYKFRSMYVNNDSQEHKEYIQDLINGHNGEGIKKMVNDPRITPIGSFIRKTSIDELPQLFNVLLGDMSLVGPRPCVEYEYESLKNWHKIRFMVKPGCTGVWQVSGRSQVSYEDMIIMDNYYVHNMSPWLDLKLIIQTVPVMLFGKGGY